MALLQHPCVITDVKGDKGQSPLDIALGPLYSNERCVDVALYLMSRGCGGDDDKAKLMCGACQTGKLGVVKELVEQHKVDPKSEYKIPIKTFATVAGIGRGKHQKRGNKKSTRA